MKCFSRLPVRKSSCVPASCVPALAGKLAFRPSRSRWARFLITAASATLACTALRAQQKLPPAAPDTVQLSLKQAVQMALRQNPSVQIAALNAVESQKATGIALSSLLPQANLNAADRISRINLRAQIGLSFPGAPAVAGPFQVVQAGADFSVPVFDLSLWQRWEAARKNEKSADAQRQSTREQIALLVVSQYLGALRAHAQVTAAQSQVDLAQALYTQASDLEKQGAATSLDALRANVELQNEKQVLIIAQTDEKVSLYGLSRLLDLNPSKTLLLTDEPSFFQMPEISSGQSLVEAYQSRPEIKALRAQQTSLEYAKRADSASRLPSLRFDGNWEEQGTQPDNAIPAYVYQAGISVPLFTGGRIHNEIARDNLELRKIQQSIEDEQNQIALEVKTAIAELQSAKSQVDVANLGVQLAKQEVEQAQDRFRAGVADNVEVTTAQDALARANENQISALYQYNESRANLARATGQMEKLYRQ